MLYDLNIVVGDSNELKYSNVCIKVGQICIQGESPLSFVTNGNGEIALWDFNNDNDLNNRIRSGKGGRY